MSKYLDFLEELEKESPNKKTIYKTKIGGNFNLIYPNGGYLPFYKCREKKFTETQIKEKKKKKREFSEKISTITQILEKRDKVPFFKI